MAVDAVRMGLAKGIEAQIINDEVVEHRGIPVFTLWTSWLWWRATDLLQELKKSCITYPMNWPIDKPLFIYLL